MGRGFGEMVGEILCGCCHLGDSVSLLVMMEWIYFRIVEKKQEKIILFGMM